MSHLDKTPRQTQDTLQRLLLSAGLGKLWCPSNKKKNMQTLCLKEKYVKHTENNEGRATYSL